MTTQELVNIYNYDDYRAYLREYYLVAKQANKEFSYRFFAKIARVPPNYLKLIIDAKRNLTPSKTFQFAQTIGLSGNEAEFFRILVLFTQSKSLEEKNDYFQKLNTIRRTTCHTEIPEKTHEALSRWEYYAIREMVNLHEFKNDPKWISKRLKGMMKPKEVEAAIQTLLELHLLTRDDNGVLKQVDAILKTTDDTMDIAIQNFHRAIIDRAKKALDDAVTDREFRSMTVALSHNTLVELKEKIKAFQRELLAYIVSCEKDPSEVYQLNIQLFSLTGKK